MDLKELKVSKNTEPKKLAGTIKHYLQKDNECQLLALGQQPICICVKSIALLSSMFSVEYQCTISYFHQSSDSGEVTGISFNLKRSNGSE